MRSAVKSTVKNKSRVAGNGNGTDPICSVCMSDEFYEDSQGGMICVACGTQSQDFLAEGFDEDDLAVYGGGTGNIVTQRNEARRKSVSDHKGKAYKIEAIADTLEALKLYQYILMMLLDACLVAHGIESATEHKKLAVVYRNTLKALWMNYLQLWHENNSTRTPLYAQCFEVFGSNQSEEKRKCSIGMAFTRSSSCRCNCRNVGFPGSHPSLPSKALMLGFIYLTFNIMRSGVVISEIIRWVLCGQVPYSNLWERVPPRLRDTVSVEMKWFYDPVVSRKHPLITYELVMFHASSLANFLHPAVPPDMISNPDDRLSGSVLQFSLPPLNAPLAAQRMIAQLGFPTIVWNTFCRLTQLFSAESPLLGANMVNQHHEETILAVIVIAVRLCDRWAEWTFFRDKISNSPPLGVGVQASCITREAIPAALAQIRRTHQPFATFGETRKIAFQFNPAVYAAMGGDVESLSKPPESSAFGIPHPLRSAKKLSNFASKDTPRFSESFCNAEIVAQMNIVGMHAHCPVVEELSLFERRRFSYLQGIEPINSGVSDTVRNDAQTDASMRNEKLPMAQPEQNGNPSAFVAYSRYDSDITSLHHDAYLRLIERCSRFSFVNPQLLHELVYQIEQQIVNMAFTRSTGVKNGANVYRMNSIRRGVAPGGGLPSVPNTTRIELKHIKTLGKKRSAQLRDVKKYKNECDTFLPGQKRKALRAIQMKSHNNSRFSQVKFADEVVQCAPENQQSRGSVDEHKQTMKKNETEHGSGEIAGNCSADAVDSELKQSENVQVIEGSKVTPILRTGRHIGVPVVKINPASEFWEIERAFEAEKEAQFGARIRKQLVDTCLLNSSKLLCGRSGRRGKDQHQSLHADDSPVDIPGTPSDTEFDSSDADEWDTPAQTIHKEGPPLEYVPQSAIAAVAAARLGYTRMPVHFSPFSPHSPYTPHQDEHSGAVGGSNSGGLNTSVYLSAPTTTIKPFSMQNHFINRDGTPDGRASPRSSSTYSNQHQRYEQLMRSSTNSPAQSPARSLHTVQSSSPSLHTVHSSSPSLHTGRSSSPPSLHTVLSSDMSVNSMSDSDLDSWLGKRNNSERFTRAGEDKSDRPSVSQKRPRSSTSQDKT